jgi:hypothetical protein
MSGHKNKFRSSENSQSNDVNDNKEEKNNETKETVKETKKVVTNVNSSDAEEDTAKIFNLGNGGPASDKAATNKQVITDPVKAWGKPRN